VQKYGTSNWSLVAKMLPGRTRKQCRERWVNQLDPSLNTAHWTPEEDAALRFHHQIHGSCWSRISASLPGRSATAIKNRWSWLERHNGWQQTAPWSSQPKEAAIDPFELVEETPMTKEREKDPWGVGFLEISWAQ
jgi:hypothetical protein